MVVTRGTIHISKIENDFIIVVSTEEIVIKITGIRTFGYKGPFLSVIKLVFGSPDYYSFNASQAKFGHFEMKLITFSCFKGISK